MKRIFGRRTLSMLLVPAMLLSALPSCSSPRLEELDAEESKTTEPATQPKKTELQPVVFEGEYAYDGEAKDVDLFVFAGQSNMMGAAVLEPKDNSFTNMAVEYKYMPRARGAERGYFVLPQNPAGEFHYINLKQAYGSKLRDLSYESTMNDFMTNSYFWPAISNGKATWTSQSEAKHYAAASIPPYFVTDYAQYGHASVFAHMALGSAQITHFFNTDMMQRYNTLVADFNAQNGTNYAKLSSLTGAGAAFDKRYKAMVEDYQTYAPEDNVKNKCLVWLQGESDAAFSYDEYKLKMKVFWEHLQELGFTHFFVLRVGYWKYPTILNVIRAQEDFCAENENCYIVTRAPSLVPYPDVTTENWWIREPDEAYSECRDSELIEGNTNYHFNEKAMKLFAKRAADNIHRILHLGQDPVLEEENIQGMK